MVELNEKGLEAALAVDVLTTRRDHMARAIRAYLSTTLPAETAGLVEEWRKAMDGVTPGPWDFAHIYPATDFNYAGTIKGRELPDGGQPVVADIPPRTTHGTHQANTEWLARCSPSGIASLLDTISAQAVEIERLGNRVAELENDIRIGFANIDRETARAETAERELASLKAACEAKDAALEPKGRVKVPEGQTPLDDNLWHRLLDVINEGQKSRETGAHSPYHGHSLEHCLHATGWVQRDLRMALDAARAHGGSDALGEKG